MRSYMSIVGGSRLSSPGTSFGLAVSYFGPPSVPGVVFGGCSVQVFHAGGEPAALVSGMLGEPVMVWGGRSPGSLVSLVRYLWGGWTLHRGWRIPISLVVRPLLEGCCLAWHMGAVRAAVARRWGHFGVWIRVLIDGAGSF